VVVARFPVCAEVIDSMSRNSGCSASLTPITDAVSNRCRSDRSSTNRSGACRTPDRRSSSGTVTPPWVAWS
jgi:hypothetical protein